jgi:glycosyltransferase involved in cell wall biosynthesis
MKGPAPIAIVTICLNDRQGLERTFASLHAQTTQEYAHAVVDGGSTDGSRELIAQHEDRIARWTSEPDAGIYDAQNNGWRMCAEQFVLFLNAGDTLAATDVLERALPLLDDTVDILYGDAMLSDERGMYGIKHHPKRMTSAWLMKESVAHQSQFIRRTLLERLGGYDTRYRIVADQVLVARAFWEQGARLRHAGFPIGVFDTRGLSSDPAQRQRSAAERKTMQRQHAPCFWFHLYHAYARLNRLMGR